MKETLLHDTALREKLIILQREQTEAVLNDSYPDVSGQ